MVKNLTEAEQIELKKIELVTVRREKLLNKLGLYKINQTKVDDYQGGINYPKIKEEITYFDVNNKDLEELASLQEEVDNINSSDNGRMNIVQSNSSEKPFISTILNVLGFITMGLSLIVSIPYFGNELLSYIGIQLLVSGIVSGLLLIGFSSVINFLSEISKNVKR
jgi:hypothetical protein